MRIPLFLSLILTSCHPAYTPPDIESTDLALARFEQAAWSAKQYHRTLAEEAAMVMRAKQRLQAAAQPLCAQIKVRHRCIFRISIIDDQAVINAFASGKTQIDIYRGLIRALPGEAELAFVIGHEIAHHLAEHLAEDAFDMSVGQTVAGTALGLAGILIGADLDTIKEAVHTGEATGHTIGAHLFSVDEEYEADYIGLYLLARAGYDVQAAVRATHHLWASTGDSTAPDFFKTHPNDDKRAARLIRAILEIDAKQRHNLELLPNK